MNFDGNTFTPYRNIYPNGDLAKRLWELYKLKLELMTGLNRIGIFIPKDITFKQLLISMHWWVQNEYPRILAREYYYDDIDRELTGLGTADTLTPVDATKLELLETPIATFGKLNEIYRRVEPYFDLSGKMEVIREDNILYDNLLNKPLHEKHKNFPTIPDDIGVGALEDFTI